VTALLLVEKFRGAVARNHNVITIVTLPGNPGAPHRPRTVVTPNDATNPPRGQPRSRL